MPDDGSEATKLIKEVSRIVKWMIKNVIPYHPSNMPFPETNMKKLVYGLGGIHRRIEKFPKMTLGSEEVFDIQRPIKTGKYPHTCCCSSRYMY